MKSDLLPDYLVQSKNWNVDELKNVEVIYEFVQLLMVEHDTDSTMRRFGKSHYVQHNRNISEGMEGITQYVKKFSKQFPDFTYEVKRVLADGDFVTFHSHATLKKLDRGNDKKGFNIIDTWRLEKGQIVEHWDSIQPLNFSMRLYALLVGGKLRNKNGVF